MVPCRACCLVRRAQDRASRAILKFTKRSFLVDSVRKIEQTSFIRLHKSTLAVKLLRDFTVRVVVPLRSRYFVSVKSNDRTLFRLYEGALIVVFIHVYLDRSLKLRLRRFSPVFHEVE